MRRSRTVAAAVAGLGVAALLAGCDMAPHADPDGAAASPQHSAPAAAPTQDAAVTPVPTAAPVPTTTPTKPAPTVTKPPKRPVKHSAALDEVVATTRPSLAALLKSSGSTYVDIDVVAVQPATLEYRFTYAETIDPAAVADYFASMVPTLQGVVDAAVGPAMVSAGVRSPKVRYTYLNPDGSTIWTHTFTVS